MKNGGSFNGRDWVESLLYNTLRADVCITEMRNMPSLTP